MMNRSDERRQTMYGAGRNDPDEDGDDDAVGAKGDTDDDEAEDEGSESTGADKVKMSQTATDAEEEGNPARMVNHGRGTPKGHEPEIEGAHQGTGEGASPMHRNTLGHGEREARMTGAHQGQHSGGAETGSGFSAGGRLGRESARGPSGTKR